MLYQMHATHPCKGIHCVSAFNISLPYYRSVRRAFPSPTAVGNVECCRHAVLASIYKNNTAHSVHYFNIRFTSVPSIYLH
jgi:hypothetical protein